MKFLKLLTRLIFISLLALPLLLISCGGGGGGGGDGGGDGGSPSYTQEDLEGIWAVENVLLNSSFYYNLPDIYHFIDETGELINVEPAGSGIVYDFSGNFVVGSVTGHSWLDHQHNATSERHISDIYYDGQFVNANEIDADWDVPNALNGISTWYRIPYTGIYDQALIDTENALILAQGVVLSGNIGTQMYIYCLSGKTVNVVDSIQEGSCGGNKILNGTIDALSGEFTGTLQYNDFCDDVRTDGFTVNGNAETAGYTDLATNTCKDYINTFKDLTYVLGDNSFSFNGRKAINRKISPHGGFLSYVFTDNNTGISYWLKDWILRHTHGEGYYENVSAFGRFYDPDYGYVELSIEEGILIYAEDDRPSSGKLVLTGAEGTQGGDTKIRITYLSATEYLVEADTNGDGVYDYNSGPLLFADLL
jgi:hypothetical protein